MEYGVGGADENTHVLRRYGCWSPESLAMRLPWYRSHFILLNCICMEAVHDILTLRLDTRPAHPSCLTVKQVNVLPPPCPHRRPHPRPHPRPVARSSYTS